MSTIIWLGGALLLFGTCFAYPQSPSIFLSSGGYQSNVLSLSVNTKKYVHTISDHFLSMTFEPSTIFLALQKNLGSTAINMAKGLSPSYLRISGPECNYFRFQGGQDTLQTSPSIPVKQGRNNITITGWHWSQLNEFVAKTGLDLIVGLNVMNRQQGKWDLSNTLDLISYSDKRGYNLAFQLGNDINSIESRIDGLSLGRDATRLRKVLEAFPRYMNTAIISPDVKSCETLEEARYLKNFITESGFSLSAVSYQLPFSGEEHIENPTAMFNYVQNQLESRIWQRDLLNKYLGKVPMKKPVWIVESGNKDRRSDFMDGLNWAQRLCAGARVGINTIMRKPSLLSLSEPTPDYWVSVLHKALIGSEVLDIKIFSGNKTRLETVAHCTKISPHDPNEGILAPEYRYNRGSITIFGVNMGSENVKILLKTGEKQSLPLHQYFLTANNRQITKRTVRSLSTMINGQRLILSPDGELPIISPKIRGSHQMITIPSQCVFFLVLPDSKSKACTAVQFEESKDSYKNGGRIVAQEEFDVTDYDTPVLDQEDESVANEKNIYVAFRPKYTKTKDKSIVQANERIEESKANNNEMTQENNENLHNNEKLQQPEPVVKYVTFSNNNWLSKFPKSLNNQEYSVEPSTFSVTEASTIFEQTEKNVSPSQSRSEKYHILAQAVTGKRYPEKHIRSDLYPNIDSIVTPHRPLQRLQLIKRSINRDLNSKEVEEIIEKFTNKEKQPLNTLLNTDESYSVVPLKLNEDHENVEKHNKKEVIQIINAKISEAQQSTVTSQTTQHTVITSTTPVTSTAVITKCPEKAESHVQKIKTRAEQALAKMTKVNEKTIQKVKGRRLQEKFKEEINPTVNGSITGKLMTSIETIIGKPDPIAIENSNNLVEKFRYNRQINSTTTDRNLKKYKFRMGLKPKIFNNIVGVENVKAANSSMIEPSTMEISTSKSTTTKVRNLKYFPKSLKLTKPNTVLNVVELNNGNSPVTKFIIKPILPPLRKVETSPNVDVDQIMTNEKIKRRLIDNLKDGKKTIQSAQTASSSDKNGGGTLETMRGLAAGAKIKALEEKIKIRRLESERRLHEKMHKINKRSPTNEMIEDDVIDINDILDVDRFKSNELDVDIIPVLKRETVRYPRSVADFTVKLNEVNTYVDRIKDDIDSKNNEIAEDEYDVTPKNWKITNDIHLSALDSEMDNVNIKSKQKSIIKELNDDNSSKTSANMMNKLINHMQTLWKYIKKTFLL